MCPLLVSPIHSQRGYQTSMPEPRVPTRPRAGMALLGATALSLPLGSIYAFSVFLAPLEKLLGASRSDLSAIFGISVIFFTIGMNLVPRLFGVLPVPAIVGLSAVLGSVGVGIASFAATFWQIAFGYGVLFALGGGMAYVGVQQAVNASPRKNPGLVNGFLVSLFPLGAMVAAPAFGWGIAAYGVRETLGGLAVVVGLSGMIAIELMWASRVRLDRPGRAAASTTDAGQSRRLLATFWKLFVVFLMAATAGLMVLSQAAGIFVAYGAGRPFALAATTAVTAAIAAARIAGGWLVDRWPVPVVAVTAQSIALTGGVLLTMWPSPHVAVAALGLIGIGYGLVSGLTAGAIALYWPRAEYGRVASRTYIAWCLAALTLPVAAAWLYDMTGGYRPAMILAAGANLIGALAAATLPRQDAPRPAHVAA
jgi:OFA family oxalate/formate antiporter-like MFS transporter